MQTVPFSLTGPIGGKTLGLIVLQTDETIEHDFKRLFAAREIALYATRIPSGAEVTPDTLTEMRVNLPAAAQLLPRATSFDVIGYGCTSGATMIGAQKVTDLVRSGATTTHVTDPLTASVAALKHLNVSRIAIVSPYIETVARPVSDAFTSAGFTISGAVSFGEEVEERVARIAPASIREAALRAGAGPDTEAVFLSCTNLRTLDVIEGLEETLGKPVVSSNLALAWHMSQLAGNLPLADAPGRLFVQPR